MLSHPDEILFCLQILHNREQAILLLEYVHADGQGRGEPFRLAQQVFFEVKIHVDH